jgi:hypothetical protein
MPCKIMASRSPPPLVGGGWGEGDKLMRYPAISPSPHPPPSKGREIKGAANIRGIRLLRLLGRRRGLNFAHGAGLTAGRAFLGFAARVHLIAAFFAGKNSHGLPPDQFEPPCIAASRPERPLRPPRQCGLGGHIIMNNTCFRQEMFKGTAGRALKLNYSRSQKGWGSTGWKPVPLKK